MEQNQARDLARKICDTWQYGPSWSIWSDELRQFDNGHAWDTYRRLVQQDRDRINVGAFIAVYNDNKPPVNAVTNDCQLCHGDCYTTDERTSPVTGQLTRYATRCICRQ